MIKTKQVYIKTFGCQMNVHDSEKMLGMLGKKGYRRVDDPQKADLIIFNTCSIRRKAEQKFYSLLGKTRRLKNINPSLKIAVAGCIAQREGKGIKGKASCVDYVIGPQNIGRVGEAVAYDEGVFVEDNPELVLTDFPAERDNKVRAWINIMYGCDNYCAYCIVPYTRGRERSRPADGILTEIKGLAAQGYKETTLLGQNVNSYNGDTSFPNLLRLINGIKGIERIRFVTSHPKDLGQALIEAMKDLDKVCEHIHLPLQSGSDRVLKLMNRKYSFDEYLGKVESLRKAIPGIAITTDIIAGFPAETDKDHAATLSALKTIEFDGIFAFKYCPRPMTRACDMDGQLNDEVKSERLTEILALQDEITLKKNRSLEKKTVEVLIDAEPEDNVFSGRTRTNKIVNVKTDRDLIGLLINVSIDEARRHSLSGTLIK